jgi:hypothetical protein
MEESQKQEDILINDKSKRKCTNERFRSSVQLKLGNRTLVC